MRKNLSLRHSLLIDLIIFIALLTTVVFFRKSDTIFAPLIIFSPLIFLLINSILLSSSYNASIGQMLRGVCMTTQSGKRIHLFASLFIFFLMILIVYFPLLLCSAAAMSKFSSPSFGVILLSLVIAVILYLGFDALIKSLFIIKLKYKNKY